MIARVGLAQGPGYRSRHLRKAHVAALIATWLLALPIQAAQPPAFDPQEYAGKVVVLDFWASWCVPCRRSFPWLNSMHGKYQDAGLVIVGVNLDMERSEAERFLAEFPADFRIVYDEEMALARRFEVMAMPSSYVIGRDGEIVAEHLGFKVRKQDEYEAVLRKALGINGETQ
jgi:thiol-disulfide isomerase/thioredoxin